MSGHSHWSTIKHKRRPLTPNAARLEQARQGDHRGRQARRRRPRQNLRFRYAIDDAKAVSMPKENIQRAIKRGTGELDGVKLEEVLYEGYGSGGVAILCEVLTDNRNRTAPEIRKIFELPAASWAAPAVSVGCSRTRGFLSSPPPRSRKRSYWSWPWRPGPTTCREGDNYAVTCDPAVLQGGWQVALRRRHRAGGA